ncbi:molybdopterin-dependent oxidoreductase [Kibdelosporangium philippinense]|uniref:Molybdopterin-dependent oxidoreductase n=1 Tax=Kibdelosporangium philippinense TaxID=211113 RepID=A0ABS8ZFA5_9PSEU|nr:molybdopterin-dependent oxidoreductase [Kibdelosporangium philippinense]MCE7005590.1 molybdopterin-dependent oxidoreductase [Kibdelosporangium philippinense]
MENSDNRLSPWRAVWAGVLGVVAAVAAGHLVAGLLDANASPFLAVGNTAVDLTPDPVKDWAIATFGTADKLVLLIGMAVVLLGFAAIAGLLSRRSPAPGTVVAVVVGALGLIAVMVRPDLGQLAILAPLASLFAGVFVFRWMHRLAQPPLSSSERRKFLQASAGVVAGIGVAGLGGQLLGSRTDVEGSRAAIGQLTPAQPAPAVPSGADFVPRTPRFLTSNHDFYRIDTALSVPKVRAEDWALRIHGAVSREMTLRYADIRQFPLVERTVTLTCVSNEVGGNLISTSNFIGVPLKDILAAAGVQPGSDQLFSTSADGWTCGTPVADIMERGLLAIGMNGEPLPVEHGFPARMVVPGLYGYVSATKWVVDMEFTTFADKQAYWLKRGWAARGPIKTQSRIDTPRGSAQAGRVTVAGVAWAQTRGIAKVEVRADGRDWVPARLAAEVSLDTWRMWEADLELAPGEYTLQCRATDRSGYTQTDAIADPVPDGATGWHTVPISVR